MNRYILGYYFMVDDPFLEVELFKAFRNYSLPYIRQATIDRLSRGMIIAYIENIS